MRTYTFEDLTRDHNVNELSREYEYLGKMTAMYNPNADLEDWWQWNSIPMVTRPLTFYKVRTECLTCSIGVERFAWMHFKQGWQTQRRAWRDGEVRE